MSEGQQEDADKVYAMVEKTLMIILKPVFPKNGKSLGISDNTIVIFMTDMRHNSDAM